MNIRQLTDKERQDLREDVLVTAYRLTRSKSAARDLTQEAFLRLDTTRPWDPSRSASLELHMFGIRKSLLSHERASMAKRRELERQAGIEQAMFSVTGRSPEKMSLDRAERGDAEALATRRVARASIDIWTGSSPPSAAKAKRWRDDEANCERVLDRP